MTRPFAFFLAKGRRIDPDAAGFVLAGGQSTRVGQDKALLSISGEPLITRALATLRHAGLQAFIAGSHADLAAFAPVIPDPEPGFGPLAGIAAALSSTRTRWNIFLSVDLPFLPASLLEYLLRRAQLTGSAVTLPSVNCFSQTFPAVLDRAVLPHLKTEFAAGRRGAYSAFLAAASALGQAVSTVPVEFLVQAGHVAHPRRLPAAWWFLNVNTPRDLRRAQVLAARSIA